MVLSSIYFIRLYDLLRVLNELRSSKQIIPDQCFTIRFSLPLTISISVCNDSSLCSADIYRLQSQLHEMFLDSWLSFLANFTDCILRTFNADATKHYDVSRNGLSLHDTTDTKLVQIQVVVIHMASHLSLSWAFLFCCQGIGGNKTSTPLKSNGVDRFSAKPSQRSQSIFDPDWSFCIDSSIYM